ncbi:MDR/zinc-dependent alcohol dehydrogenase-like family protein [Enterococcus rivorum]|uniref:hypothetical protein n=1 Tax=Enterococcus rivorum TaxID=762845 RepID=UPI003636BC2B
MSIDMYLGQARSQAASVKSVCNQLSQGYSSLLQSNQQFIGTGELSSKAYDSAKAFFSAVIQPLVQGAEVGAEMTAEACQKFVDQYTSEVDSIDLKSDQLERRIQQVNQSIQNIQHINNSLPSLPLGTNPLKQINQRIIESLETTKRDLEKKLEKLLAFNATSPAIFSEVNAFYGTLAQGLQQANTSFNPSTGTFTLPQNLSWRNTVNEKWKVYQDKKRKNAKELENFSDYTIIKISTTEVSEYYQLSKAGNTPEENARISALYNKMVLEGKIIGGQSYQLVII